MKAAYEYAGTILSVDLSNRTVKKLPLDPELARNYIGGHGINAKLLYDLIKPGIDPLSPENVLTAGCGDKNVPGAGHVGHAADERVCKLHTASRTRYRSL